MELLGYGRRQVHRDRVQRPPRQVHRRVPVEDVPPVLDFERVRQLETEGEPAGGGSPAKVVEHGERVGPAQVVAERLVGDRHVPVAERVVHDAPYPLGAEQRRVALHRGVEAALLEQVERDRLDLVGRAAVHRRQRHRVGEAGGDVDLADGRVAPGHDLHAGRQVARGVGHGVEVPLHVRRPDAGQVVAHAHVEDHAGTLPGPAEPVVEGVDEDPGPEVLVERLVDLEFLRPLDVVPLVLDVDAGFVDVQLVERLDRLEFDQAGAHQPCGDDVLGHLGVGPGGDAERRLQLDPVFPAAEAMVEAGDEEGLPGHVEDRALLLQLGEDPVGRAAPSRWGGTDRTSGPRTEPARLPSRVEQATAPAATERLTGGRAGGRPAPGPLRGSRPRLPGSADRRRRPPRRRPRSGAARIPAVKATCHGSIGSYDQVTSSLRASGTRSQPVASHDQAVSGPQVTSTARCRT